MGVFHALGVRQVHLAYNRNNEIGGGCYDEDIPLSPLGRQVVEAIHGNGMLMDPRTPATAPASTSRPWGWGR